MRKNFSGSMIAIAAMAVCATSCGGNSSNAESNGADSTIVVNAKCDGVSEVLLDSVTVLYTLQDNAGEHRMPNSLFYGVDNKDSARVEELSPSGSVASSIHCFLMEKEGKKVLFDTGIGEKAGGCLLARLDSIGVAPDDIDYLLITHFHNDHIGGMLRGDSVVFPNAEVYVPEVEYAYWAKSGEKGENAMKTMKAYGDKLHQFSFTDSTALPLGIKAMAAMGHTPGHALYMSGRLLVIADLVHGYDLQVQDMNICPAYDMNPVQAVESRKFFFGFAERKKLVMAGMHMPGNGILINK